MDRQTAQNGANAMVRLTKDCVDLSGAVHMLPCSIGHSGPAAVSTYFTPAATGGRTNEGLLIQEAAFRGRGLQGLAVELPSDYCGYVLGKNSTTTSQESKFDEWQTLAQFQNMTYWNHDSKPSSSDPIPRCFDWLHLSNIIHGTISEEEVRSMMEEQNTESRGVKRKSSSLVS